MLKLAPQAMYNNVHALGDNLIVPTYYRQTRIARVAMWTSVPDHMLYLKDMQFMADGERIVTTFGKQEGVNVSDLSLLPRSDCDILYPNKYRVAHKLPKGYGVLHYNSHFDRHWALNNCRLIFDHVWEYLLQDDDLMESLGPLINISPEHAQLHSRHVQTYSFNLGQLVDVIKHARFLVGVSSAPSVLACMLGKPVLVSWADEAVLPAKHLSASQWHKGMFYLGRQNVHYFSPQTEAPEIVRCKFKRFALSYNHDS